MRLKIYLTLAFFCIALNICLAQADPPFNYYATVTQYDSVIQANMQAFQIPGLTAVIVHKDNILYREAFGVTSTLTGRPVDLNTRFRLASLSKGFTAVLTGLLVNAGKLHWDDPFQQYLPGMTLNTPFEQEITLQHLLSQSSGFEPYTCTDLLEQNYTYDYLIENLSMVSPLDPPGVQFGYQNVVFNLISDIMCNKTGESFEELCWQELFYPLGMQATNIGLAGILSKENYARPHIRIDSMWVPTEPKPSYYRVPASAGINSNIKDMTIWLKAMMGVYPGVIPDHVRYKVMDPVIDTDKSSRYFGAWEHLGTTQYALGWRIFYYRDELLIYHGGYVEGYRAEIAILPERQLGMVIMMNAAPPFADNCVPMFLELLFKDKN